MIFIIILLLSLHVYRYVWLWVFVCCSMHAEIRGQPFGSHFSSFNVSAVPCASCWQPLSCLCLSSWCRSAGLTGTCHSVQCFLWVPESRSNGHACMLSTFACWASPSNPWNGFKGTVPDCSWWFLVETRGEFGYMVDVQEKSHFIFHSSVAAHVFNKLDVPLLLVCWIFRCDFNF